MLLLDDNKKKTTNVENVLFNVIIIHYHYVRSIALEIVWVTIYNGMNHLIFISSSYISFSFGDANCQKALWLKWIRLGRAGLFFKFVTLI